MRLTSLWLFGQALLFFWLFGWLPTKPPQWLTGSFFDNSGVVDRLNRVIFLCLLTMISRRPFLWIDTARLRQRSGIADLPKMVRLILAARRSGIVLVIMALTTIVIAWEVFRGIADPFAVRIAVVLFADLLLIFLLPPTVIVLAASSQFSKRLFVETKREMLPFRVVSLLDGKLRVLASLGGVGRDNLRTVRVANWRAAIGRLVEITPLVIVDARFPTLHVCEEISYLVDAHSLGKAIFVINDNGTAPALEAVGVDTVHHPLVCYPARDIPAAVARFRDTGEIATITSKKA